MWNESILDELGRLLGTTHYMQWSRWERGLASSVGSWKAFKELPKDQKVQLVSHLRGSARRIQ